MRKKIRASIKARIDDDNAIKTTMRVSPCFKREREIVDEIGMIK